MRPRTLNQSDPIWPPLEWGADDVGTPPILELLNGSGTQQRKFAVVVSHQFTDHIAAAAELAINLASVDIQVVFLPWSGLTSALPLGVKSRSGGWHPSRGASPDRLVGALLTSLAFPNLNVVRPAGSRPARPGWEPSTEWVSSSHLHSALGLPSPRFADALIGELSDRLRWNPDEFLIHNHLIGSYISEYLELSEALSDLVEELSITDVVLFNGRFAASAAVIDTAEDMHLQVWFHEGGGELRGYDVHEHSAHDRSALQRRMARLIPTVQSDDQAYKLGLEWFSQRGVTANFHPNSASFRNRSKENLITFFSSSPDEFSLFADDQRNRYLPQLEAIRAAIELARSTDSRLVLRTHPNMRTKSVRERNAWHSSLGAFNDIHVIHEDEDADSFALVEQSDLVLTYGSTIGIEAMVAGKPTITMGASIYSYLLEEPVAYSLEDLMEVSGNIWIPAPERLLAYGLFLQTRGFPYLNYKSNNHGTGVFLGKRIPRLGRLSNVVPAIHERRQASRIAQRLVRAS